MKINIEVNLDWLEEDGSIDDEIQEKIINGINQSISKTCIKKMETESLKVADQAISSARKLIENKALKFADDWLETEATITDKWGDAEGTSSIKDLIKRSFDNTLEKKVDSDGNFTSSSYNGMKAYEYLIGKKCRQLVSEKLKSMTKDMDESIEKLIKDGIKDRVSDKFAQMVIGAAGKDYAEAKAIEG